MSILPISIVVSAYNKEYTIPGIISEIINVCEKFQIKVRNKSNTKWNSFVFLFACRFIKAVRA